VLLSGHRALTGRAPGTAYRDVEADGNEVPADAAHLSLVQEFDIRSLS
jgi:hypothetical protein